MRSFRKWISEYTLASKEATNGRLKEVFRGSEELDKYIGEIESVTVHSIPPQAGFDIIGRGRRILYAWTNKAEIITNSEGHELKEDEKAFIDSRCDRFTVGNKSSNSTSLIVEVCSLPFAEISYKRIGTRNAKHLPVLREAKETEEVLDCELSQITVHNFNAYDFRGNHYHLDDKKALYLVVDGLVHVFERRVDTPSEGFEIVELLERIKSRDKDFAIYYDTYATGGVFSFDTHDRELRLSHATAAGKKGTKFIELANVAFDPEYYEDSAEADILVPPNYNMRKKLIDLLPK